MIFFILSEIKIIYFMIFIELHKFNNKYVVTSFKIFKLRDIMYTIKWNETKS
jgi:hypothetical protein